MILTYAAFALGLIGILMAWSAHRKNKELRERIAQVNSRVYHLRQEIQTAQEESDRQRMALKFEILELQGALKINPEMTIGEIIAVQPQAAQVLAGFHLGGCASCMVDDNQTLAEAATVNGRELAPIVMALNTLLTESENGHGLATTEQLKTPNVALQI